ncbi:hypothetical protein Pmani_020066 [Petrolisthes manimaculis]|uniref:Protein FMC1 homolog n=1 Tax=Petrolisthes manimaculis TaxID=1843537 RepID=A0AAE1PJ69_9EUCA|nr:hypothetical protein Pmani_020066 [Petrolisthes manimaculis]
MASTTKIQTLRSLIKELRRSIGNHDRVQQTPIFSYVMNEYRRNAVTDQQYCHQQEEMTYLAETCATYLTSSRRYLELYDDYHGCGERSVKETASIVGFKLPNEH